MDLAVKNALETSQTTALFRATTSPKKNFSVKLLFVAWYDDEMGDDLMN